jgi:predicted TIM-barrel fold metal-dependent hydrolase
VPYLVVGRGARPLEEVALDLRARREVLYRAGISWQLLSLSSLWNVDNLPAAEALPLVRAFNDDTCQAVAEAPLLFGGLASLPLQNIQASCEELHRTRHAGLLGAILPADAFASLQQATLLAPLLREADALAAHLFVHPGYLHAPARLACRSDNWWPRAIVLEVQHQLSSAMLSLCSSRLLDAYPNVSIQVANLGGGIPLYLERLQAVASVDRFEAGKFRFNMAKIVVDTASFGPLGIRLAKKALGIDKIVLGTDMPIFDALQAAGSMKRRSRTPETRGKADDRLEAVT